MASKSSPKAAAASVPRGKKKPTNPLIGQLAAQAGTLSPQDRATLIALLRAQGARPKHYEELDNAFSSVLRIRLAHHSELSKDIDTVCDVLDTALEGVADKRARHAVLCAVIKAASERLLHQGAMVNARMVLYTLRSEVWEELLNEAYPGYGIKLLGQVLCQGLSSGRVYSPKQE